MLKFVTRGSILKKDTELRVLVTGGAGFIGSHLSESLSKSGHVVTVMDSLSDFLYPSDLKILNMENFKHHRISFYKMNLVTDELDEIVSTQDVVINLAAIPGLVKSWKYLQVYSESNILGLGRLLESCCKARIKRFIQISTSSVYGINATGNETVSLKPFSPYGVTKLAAENLARAYEANFGMPVTILRYFSVYGPRQRPDMAYQRFITAILDGDPFFVYGDGKQTRTNTYVDDIVKGTIQSTNLELDLAGKTFNLAGSEKIVLLNAIKIIEKITSCTAKFDLVQKSMGDQLSTNGDYSLAFSSFGYKPEVPFEEGISRQITWHLSHRSKL